MMAMMTTTGWLGIGGQSDCDNYDQYDGDQQGGGKKILVLQEDGRF